LTANGREATLRYVAFGVYLLSAELKNAQRRGRDLAQAVEGSPVTSAVWSALFPTTSPARVISQIQKSGRPVAQELNKLLTEVLHV
jgi:hypothetical protein